MKKLLLTALILTTGTAATFAQKYMTRTARITFDASAKGSPEKIEAINNEVANIFDASKGAIVFQAPVKSFKFEKALMQEHFNENYMESDKYTKAEFSGNIDNMSDVNLSKDGTYNAKISGKLTIHGVSQAVTVPGSVTVKGGELTLKAKFSVKLEDYKISVPSVVADKIGKEASLIIESSPSKK